MDIKVYILIFVLSCVIAIMVAKTRVKYPYPKQLITDKTAINYLIAPRTLPDRPEPKPGIFKRIKEWISGPGGPEEDPDYRKAYDIYSPGPYPGSVMGVMVPQESLKETSEKYQGSSLYREAFKSFFGSPTIASVNEEALGLGPYNAPGGRFENPYPGSLNPLPLPAWQKVGILTYEDHILNLYRKLLAPGQDLWQYQVEDTKGFFIPLKETYLENGDRIEKIIGKKSMGPWKVHMDSASRWIYM